MKNTFGTSVAVTLFGESHGTMIGAVLDGMAPGIPVDEDVTTSLYTDEIPEWLQPYLAAALRSGMTNGLPVDETGILDKRLRA